MAQSHALTGSLTEPVRQRPEDVNALISALETHTGGKSKTSYRSRKTTFNVPDSNITLNSWKFGDYDYKKYGLPTSARGLFTFRDEVSGNHEIATRGYDKFFNIDEVHQTKWDWIQTNTKAPYELTLKENGCIIFLSGLPNGKLLVCSKHSTGTSASHALAGESWVEKHLASVGKTKDDLARTLRDLNATAVAELCDDEFEEHILAYEKGKSGLYLHGINFNVPIFATCSAAEVHKFANEWGFIKTNYIEMDSVTKMRNFLEEAAETGSWDGQDVEGFVIRCKARHGPNDPHWHDWFFKYKFEEPYLMYRQWRECTKSMISGKTPNPKKHVKVTHEYLAFAKQYFLRNPKAAEQYQKNHGIIALRNAFLANRGAKGSDLVKEDEEGATTVAGNGRTNSIVLVPVATIGCGKTTVATAMVKLFNWGHVQNDNITQKPKPTLFAESISKELISKPVVIADRNNHQKRERQALMQDVSGHRPDTVFVALHYVHDKDGIDSMEFRQRIRKATQDRVFSRGDKHQTIHASTMEKKKLLGIMEGFLNRFEPVDTESSPDIRFDAIIDLDVEASSRENLETIVKKLRRLYPNLITKEPTPEEYDAAIKYSIDEYSPNIKHKISGDGTTKNTLKQVNVGQHKPQPQSQPQSQNQKTATKTTEFFSVTLPTSLILDLLSSTFSDTSNVTSSQAAFYNTLKATDRIQQKFHITLIHRANSTQPHNKLIWEQYNALFQNRCKGDYSLGIGSLKVKLENIVWDGRCMAITAKFLDNENSFPCVNKVAHITIGTASLQVKPKESNDMLIKWLKEKGRVGGSGEKDIQEVNLVEIGQDMDLEGIVKAIPQGRR